MLLGIRKEICILSLHLCSQLGSHEPKSTLPCASGIKNLIHTYMSSYQKEAECRSCRISDAQRRDFNFNIPTIGSTHNHNRTKIPVDWRHDIVLIHSKEEGCVYVCVSVCLCEQASFICPVRPCCKLSQKKERLVLKGQHIFSVKNWLVRCWTFQ